VKKVFLSGPSREAWSTRYEQLRAGWLVQEFCWGQALLIHQGMAAWMKAWSMAVPSPQTLEAPSPIAKPDSAQNVAMGDALQRQLVHEFTNLLLHRQQEVLA